MNDKFKIKLLIAVATAVSFTQAIKAQETLQTVTDRGNITSQGATFGGTVSASPGTASGHLVTKSQLDMKANADGSNTTGTWGIGISGTATNSTQWNYYTHDMNSVVNSDAGLIDYLLTVQGGKVSKSAPSAIKTKLGLPATGGYTLQDTYDRSTSGNVATILSANQGSLFYRVQSPANGNFNSIGLGGSGRAQIRGFVSDAAGGGDDLVLATGNATVGTTEKMRILANGNVGIGTTLPQQKFVVSNGGAEGFEVIPSLGYSTLISYNRSTSAYVPMNFYAGVYTFGLGPVNVNSNLGVGGTGTFTGIVSMPTGSYIKGTGTGNSNLAYLSFYESNGTTRQGNIGIGSGSNSDVYLTSDVGNIRLNPPAGYKVISQQDMDITGMLKLSRADAVMSLTGINNNNWHLQTVDADGRFRIFSQIVPQVEALSVLKSGNVGIGTTAPDEKLTVNGKIHAKEIRVDLNVPGPDYVFEADYQVPSLLETEQFIKAHKHLPEIPPAKEMEKEGVNLSDMNMLLLKKVEELTLYLIAKDKELTQLKAQIKSIQQQINADKNLLTHE